MTQTPDRHTAAIDVAVIAHPFSIERVQHRCAAGGTVADILRGVQPDPLLSRYAHVYLNGHYIPQTQWRRVTPHAGTILTIRMVPMGGGGGKNPLRTVLSLALVAAAPVLAGGIAGVLGVGAQTAIMGISAGRIITAGVNLLGRLALNALAPPGRPRFGQGTQESATLFLQGARNQTAPFARVPKVLGKHRFVPPLGALPYTETIGNDQYLRMIFIWGYGPLHISDLKIGETPLSAFDGVDIETRQGFADDPPLTLYTNSVMQNDMDVVVKQSGGYIVRTTDTEADEISVDITLPRGLVRFNGNGKKVLTDVQMDIQYSPAGMDDWSAGGDSYKPVDAQTVTLSAKPAAYVYGFRTHTVARIDRIVMDSATGSVRVIQGISHRQGIDADAAAAPPVPENGVSLAKILRSSTDGSGTIAPTAITDDRTAAIANGVVETDTDFAVTPHTTAQKLTVAAGGLRFPGLFIRAKQSSALRRAVSFRVPRGRYDVRVRRLTDDSDDDKTFNDTVWTALRSLRYAAPVKMQGLAMTALRIKATDQLNGLIDRFNGVVHSILPDWNGSAWIEQVTANPASLYRHVLQGSANARPLADGRLDVARLEEWHNTCAAQAREFNAVIDYDVSVREVLQDIAAAGRASPTILDGQWSIIEDRAQTVPVQHFTPRNTYGFEGHKAFDDIPDALRVRFINRDKGWLQDERLVCRDGFTPETATRFESLSLPGITSAQQAWRDGRYHLATAVLRPETFSFYCDIEHIVCTRGDLIRFTHDVPLFGLGAARVVECITEDDTITALQLDAPMEMEADKNYSLRLRTQTGASIFCPLETVEGKTQTLSLSTPVNTDTGIAAGDLVQFGESGQESVLLVVKSIEPQNNLNARITCVAAAPAIHSADTGAIPPFASQITVPPSMQRPPAPVATRIQSGLESAVETGNGGWMPRIVISLSPPAFSGRLHIQAQIRAKGESDYYAAETTPLGSGQCAVSGVTEDEIYDLRLRYFTEDGIFSAALNIAGYRVTGSADAPSDVSWLSLNIAGSAAYLSWAAIPDRDLDHYALRFAPVLYGAAWNSAVDVVTHIPANATTLSVPAAVGTYLLKAVDSGGRLSENPALAISGIAALAGYNAVLNVDAAPDFLGTHDNTVVDDDALLLAEGETAGFYTFDGTTDLGAVYTSRMTAEIGASGIDRAESVDDWDNHDAIENRDSNADPARWHALLQIRTTADDPTASPVWSDWRDFAVGDYTARACQFRLRLGSDAPHITPVISTLRVGIDMPDRTTGVTGIDSDADGTNITFGHAFRATPALAITAQNMSSGDYYTITAQTADGFSIRFFDSSHSGVVRSFDYLAKGYGEAV